MGASAPVSFYWIICMALSNAVYTGNGSNNNFNVTFPYLRQQDVVVLVNGVSVTYSFISSGIVQTTVAPANGARVVVKRVTPTSPLVDFNDASTLTEADLDTSKLQSFYIAQEALDALTDNLALDYADDKFNAQSKRIKNLQAPLNASDAATKDYVDTVMSGVNPISGLPAANVTVANGTGLSAANVQAALAELTTEKAEASHAHTIANVTGLQAALDAKVDDSQVSAFALTLLDDVDAATARATLNAASTSVATTVAHGLMASTDKVKLNALTNVPDVIFQDQKLSGSGGGTPSAGAWNKRDLNTTLRNTLGSDAVLSSSVVALAAGTYVARWVAPHMQIAGMRTRLRDTTNGTTLGLSNWNVSGSGDRFHGAQTEGVAVFTLAGTANIELQYYSGGSAGSGLGYASSTGEAEVYSTLEITKVR